MNVTRIEKKIKKIKACAYVRVSTKQDEQEESFDTQMRYWEGKLKSDPSLDFVGIFSDEGISGRKVEQRTGYQRMMELVRQGEIDRIYVKSVSRFGRNKLEALRAIQEVRNYNAEIIFEKENLTTSDPKSSFSLTVMTTFAEAESESLSKNIKWRMQSKLENGLVDFHRCFGYNLVDKKLVINVEEANWIRYIFESYTYQKKPIDEIVDDLLEKGVTNQNGKRFSTQMIRSILKNVVYIGDSERQKTVTKNGKKKENDGRVKKYYFKDTHPAIITRELFGEAQTSKPRKYKGKKIFLDTGGALSRKLKCTECGSVFKAMYDGLWLCPGYSNGCSFKILQEQAIIYMVKKCMELYNESIGDIDELNKLEDEQKAILRKNDLLRRQMVLGELDETEYERQSDELVELYNQKKAMATSLKKRNGKEFNPDKMTNKDILSCVKCGLVYENKSIEMTLTNGFKAKIKYPKLEKENYIWII